MTDERALLSRLQALEEEALEVVYDTFRPSLYRYAYRLLGQAEAAEDVVAETFYRLLQALARGQGPRRHLQAWLYRVAHNLVVDQYRRQKGRPLPLDEELLPEEGAEEQVQQLIAREQVRQALCRLTRDQQQVVMMRFLEGMSTEEVAAALGKPVGAVKSLQHRALAAMRRFLQPRRLGKKCRPGGTA